MVRYDEINVSAPSVTGAIIPDSAGFRAWQPSTWPASPAKLDPDLIKTLRTIFYDSMLNEIDNVIADAGGNLTHRGHVVAISLLCALDAISSYGYGAKSGNQIPPFVRPHFPVEYRPHAKALLKIYRHAMVHSWNLFGATILPGNESVTNKGGLCFGLLHFRAAISTGVDDFLKKLETDKNLQTMALKRYRKLKTSAKN